MIVWCKLCETNPVDVHPDDALHESFTDEDRPVCEICVIAMKVATLYGLDTLGMLLGLPGVLWDLPDNPFDLSEWFGALGPYESPEKFA